MKIDVIRCNLQHKSTGGIMFVDGKFECFTKEDAVRDKKIKGETAIPYGCYEVRLREVISPLTLSYQKRYPFFDFHLELQNVPNYQHIYIHVGNNHSHTDGCLLVGDVAENVPAGTDSVIGKSVQAFTRLYPKIRAALKRGDVVWLEIKKPG